MIRPAIILISFLEFAIPAIQTQESVTFKYFNVFRGVVSGVDFYATSKQAITPYEKAVSEARQRMVDLLGSDLPKGAVFVCSTLQQKDSVYEPRALRMGYAWDLIVLTPEIRGEEMLERLKAQMGGKVSPEALERIKSRTAAVESGQIRTLQQQLAFAILQKAFAPDRDFRFSRVDDVVRSPLPDWLDIGIAAYALGGGADFGFLQQHLEETFRLEDVFTMSRPFVAPNIAGGGGGSARVDDPSASGGPAGPPAAGSADSLRQGGGGRRGSGPRVLPKDEQDRMLFDSQASTFFAFLLKKVGIEKVKELVQFSREGRDSAEFIMRKDILGPDLSKVEGEWIGFVKAQAAPEKSRNPSR